MTDGIRCSACGAEITQANGRTLIKKDGTKAYFCSERCAGPRKPAAPKLIAWIVQRPKQEKK